jgi:hypothetical protein
LLKYFSDKCFYHNPCTQFRVFGWQGLITQQPKGYKFVICAQNGFGIRKPNNNFPWNAIYRPSRRCAFPMNWQNSQFLGDDNCRNWSPG